VLNAGDQAFNTWGEGGHDTHIQIVTRICKFPDLIKFGGIHFCFLGFSLHIISLYIFSAINLSAVTNQLSNPWKVEGESSFLYSIHAGVTHLKARNRKVYVTNLTKDGWCGASMGRCGRFYWIF
jgi:hypothetical protein